MFNKALIKDTLREIWNTKSRFISIFAIILIGVAFFSGLVATSPVMIETANTYYNEQNLADMQVISPFGYTEEDIDEFSQVRDATVDVHKTVDVLDDENRAFRLFGYSEDHELNDYLVLEGRLPEEPNEIALDSKDDFLQEYDIGDNFSLETDASFDNTANINEEEFEIVGFVQTPMFVEDETRGTTAIGAGVLEGFGVVTEDAIDLEESNLVHLKFDELSQNRDVYSEDYQNEIDDIQEEYEDVFNDRAEERKQNIIDQAQEELDEGRNQIQEAEDQLEEGRQALEEARDQLDQAQEELEDRQGQIQAAAALYGPNSELVRAGQAQLEEAQNQIQEAEEEYESNLAEFEEAEAEAQEELEDARAQLEEGEEELAEFEETNASMFYNTSLDFPGVNEYGENADRIQAISRVFPVFFFALAILISLTTMSRIVNEGRTQIGTMKALGYNNTQISAKYFTYALLATVLGGVIGLPLGFWLFPTVIVNAYEAAYQLIDAQISFYPGIAAIAFVGAVLATSIATFASLRSMLKENAASLLRPKAPKSGQRIFLERISWIWDRLGFIQKVSVRNLFRYKGRLFMTIIGVAGGVALMLTGFGLYDSIQGIGELQFNEISNYDATSVVDTNAEEDQVEEVEDTIADSDLTEDFIRVSTQTMTLQDDQTDQELSLMIPESAEELEDYMELQDYDTDERLALPEDGALVTQKIAELEDISIGDTVVLEDYEDQEYEVEVAGIVNNYVAHYVYVSPEYWETVSDADYDFDTRLIRYDQNAEVTAEAEGEFEDQLVDLDATLAVNLMTENLQTVEDSLSALSTVMVVLILSAAILAFVVLYNVTNINVSERVEELSTIKVLGFFDMEVTRYVYRETFTLSIIGILVGLIFGFFLHQYIIETVELNYIMFSRTILWPSYLYSAGLMVIFSIIVMVIMHFKLKSIDMVEALS